MGSFSLSNQKSTIRPDNKTTNSAGNHHLFGVIGFSRSGNPKFRVGSSSNFFCVFAHSSWGFCCKRNQLCMSPSPYWGYQGFPGLDSGKLGNFELGRVSDFSGFLKTLVGVLAARENTRENENKQS